MKLSIWQQFSSNHSGSFAVVGRFASEAEANAAAEKLAEIVRRIDAWHENLANETAYQHDPAPLTPVEEAIRKEYAIDEWDYQGIDWYGQYEPIRQIGRDLYFRVDETWGTPKPITSLLAKLGGQPYEQSQFDGPITSVVIRLTCAFDNAQTTEQVTAQLEDWIDSRFGAQNWHIPDNLFQGAEDAQVSRQEARLTLEIDYGVEVIPRLLEWLRDQGARELEYNLGHGLPALVNWLKEKGCTGFEYELVETINEDD